MVMGDRTGIAVRCRLHEPGADAGAEERPVTALVTGAAGFIGSTLVDDLLADGQQVRGVDCFSPYYDLGIKRENIAGAVGDRDHFELVQADLLTAYLEALLDGVDVVYHHAAQPGVRLSWSEHFDVYARCNVLATQRLLEASVRAGVERFVYASSSSIYGNADHYPTDETVSPRPHSPYGVTKLAAEHLCGLYAENWGLHTVALRYFTVFGPRQRPDMSIHRLCEAALTGRSFPRFGDGRQVREFTYVGDIVDANLCAADAAVAPGTVVNIAGGGEIELNDLIATVGELAGTEVEIENHPAQAGDARRNGGATTAARQLLDWEPRVGLRDGIAAQLAWHADRRLLV
jgi:nucleoside-diphosphate-sugar epimerase